MTSTLNFHRAGADDLPILVETRLTVLRAANGLPPDTPLARVRAESEAYYRAALAAGDHLAILVYDQGVFVGAGGVSFYRVMPTVHNPTGQKAYIMNLYTDPAYRRCGIARRTLALLVEEAKARGVLQISLEATAMGRPLYAACGFTPMPDEMELL
ncbi:MAG: GNAT family N-acetyltransferase [Oscillospiraceae bacterium]|nr:GNAT family N-acetyltransferase [Oscillospiraceae bacterium]